MRNLAAVLALSSVIAGSLQAGDAQVPGPIERVDVSRNNLNVPIPVGTEADVYCTGWISDPSDVFPGIIKSAEMVDSQYSFMPGDIVYIDIGTNQGAAAGQEFWVVRPGELVNKFGSVTEYVGRHY